MKKEEECDCEGDEAGEHIRSHHKQCNIVLYVLSIKHDLDQLIRCPHDGLRCHRTIKQQAYEVLVVAEANAVGDPRAVMVHLEYALVTLTAMVAPVWFSAQASLAHAHSTQLLPLYRCLHELLRIFNLALLMVPGPILLIFSKQLLLFFFFVLQQLEHRASARLQVHEVVGVWMIDALYDLQVNKVLAR